MGDWLGTGYIASRLRKFRPFKEAKVYVHSLGLKSKEAYAKYAKSGKKPMDIPADIYSHVHIFPAIFPEVRTSMAPQGFDRST
jgi:hypothetical protein